MSKNIINFNHVSKKFTRINAMGIKSLFLKKVNVLNRSNKKDNNFQFREWALDNISFSIQQGDSLAVFGHNGSGKSTILSLLSQVILPTKGVVEVKGRSASLLELGVGFDIRLSGSENIFLFSSFLGRTIGETNKIYTKILDFSELGGVINNQVRTYSSGMIARLMFSILISIEPDILFIDEVYAVGDNNFKKKSIDYIKKFINNGGSVVFVTHDIKGVNEICNKGICIKQGKLISKYDLKDAIKSYINE